MGFSQALSGLNAAADSLDVRARVYRHVWEGAVLISHLPK